MASVAASPGIWLAEERVLLLAQSWGQGVGVVAPQLSAGAAEAVLAATESEAAAVAAGAATFSALNGLAGALGTIATNCAEGQPLFKDAGIGAAVGAAAPLLSGEAVLAGAGGGVAAGLSEYADYALAAQTGVFGTIGAIVQAHRGQQG